jgi:hypothetical protein
MENRFLSMLWDLIWTLVIFFSSLFWVSIRSTDAGFLNKDFILSPKMSIIFSSFLFGFLIKVPLLAESRYCVLISFHVSGFALNSASLDCSLDCILPSYCELNYVY